MKILIDIGHPGHVHYFKNFIKIMKNKAHEFLVIARNKEVTFNLLNHYDIPYVSRGCGGKSVAGKISYIPKADYFILKHALRFQPDLLLSFGSTYAAHASFLLRKPHIAFDDTEHAKFEHMMYVPFTSIIITPSCFFKDFGEKQIKFSGYMELCSLHPKYFKASNAVLNILGVKENERYVLIRFVSWEASHDAGINGMNLVTKIKLVEEITKYARVFISSEGPLPELLKTYKLQTPPALIHDVIASAALYIGEGATTASECAVLGIPSIYINKLSVGYCKEQEDKYGLLFNFRTADGLINKAIELLSMQNLNAEWQNRRKKMLADKIDVTAFMVWFIENYPSSIRIMKENPDYQYRFK